MTVRLDGEVIRLEGDCHVEQAETLLVLAREADGRSADLSECRLLHAALAQVLISHAIPVAGLPPDRFLRDHVLPNLTRANGSGDGRHE